MFMSYIVAFGMLYTERKSPPHCIWEALAFSLLFIYEELYSSGFLYGYCVL